MSNTSRTSEKPLASCLLACLLSCLFGWLVAWLSLVKEGRISFISVKYPLKSSEASCSYSCPHNVAILQSQIRAIGNYNKRQVSVSSFYCRSDYKFDQGPKLVWKYTAWCRLWSYEVWKVSLRKPLDNVLPSPKTPGPYLIGFLISVFPKLFVQEAPPLNQILLSKSHKRLNKTFFN